MQGGPIYSLTGDARSERLGLIYWRSAAMTASRRLRGIPRKPSKICYRSRFRSGRVGSAPTGGLRGPRVTASSEHPAETLWEDGEFVLSRDVWDGEPFPLLVAMPSSAQPSPETLARLRHAYELREELDPAWAARPLRLEPNQGRLTLLIEDPGGEPLLRLMGRPLGDRVVSAPRDRDRYGGWSGSPARPHP